MERQDRRGSFTYPIERHARSSERTRAIQDKGNYNICSCAIYDGFFDGYIEIFSIIRCDESIAGDTTINERPILIGQRRSSGS